MNTPLEKPTNVNRDAWQAYWQQMGQPWRTEPEISLERQNVLEEKREIKPDIDKGIYPFKDIVPKLIRADIEWLLATHDNGKGPIDWSDISQHERQGLDLRDVDLAGTEEIHLDLHGLPLARTQFGLTGEDVLNASDEIITLARANLTFVDLTNANLQGAILTNTNLQNAILANANLQSAKIINANLQNADLTNANLQSADLYRVNLQGAFLNNANLQAVSLGDANLQSANLNRVNLQCASLGGANLQSAFLTDANLQSAILNNAILKSASLGFVNLQSAYLRDTNLQSAKLHRSNLQSTELTNADMQSADLTSTNLQSAILNDANLRSANLTNVTFNSLTRLDGVALDAHIQLADITWSGVNLVTIDWSFVSSLGDEIKASHRRNGDSIPKSRDKRLSEYRASVRAYRLLVTTLRNQGMNEEADRFSYRAQVCQRAVLRLQRQRGQWLWSGLLDLIAGYGYRPVRSFLAYVLIILTFGVIYFLLGQASHPLNPEEAFVVSMTAFHGRGFFAGQFQPGDPQALAAAFEAFIGLMIEVSFIATFTQRFFGK